MDNVEKLLVIIENKAYIFNSQGYDVEPQDILDFLKDVKWRQKDNKYISEMVRDIHMIDINKVIEYKNTKEMIENTRVSFDEFKGLFGEEIEEVGVC